MLPLSGKDHIDDHHYRNTEDQMNPAPTYNEEPVGTLSAYVVPVSFQDMPSAPPTRIDPSPINFGVAIRDATPKDQSNVPAFKDQACSVGPPPSFYIPTVDATPVEDSKVEVDTPNELDDIGETPNRRRGIDP